MRILYLTLTPIDFSCSPHHSPIILFLMFQLKDCLTNIGQHLRSKHWCQLDNVLTNKSAKPYVTVTKVNREENCFTDYRLLILSVSSPLKGKKRVTRPPKKLDIRLDDDTEFDELRVVRQNAATHMSWAKRKEC